MSYQTQLYQAIESLKVDPYCSVAINGLPLDITEQVVQDELLIEYGQVRVFLFPDMDDQLAILEFYTPGMLFIVLDSIIIGSEEYDVFRVDSQFKVSSTKEIEPTQSVPPPAVAASGETVVGSQPSAVSSSDANDEASWAASNNHSSCLDPQQGVKQSVSYMTEPSSDKEHVGEESHNPQSSESTSPATQKTKRKNTWQFCHNCGMYSHVKEDCQNDPDPLLVWQRLKKRDERRIKRQKRQAAKRAANTIETRQSDSEDSGWSSSSSSVGKTEVHLASNQPTQPSLNDIPTIHVVPGSQSDVPTAGTLVRESGAVETEADPSESEKSRDVPPLHITGEDWVDGGQTDLPDTTGLSNPADSPAEGNHGMLPVVKDAVKANFNDAMAKEDARLNLCISSQIQKISTLISLINTNCHHNASSFA